MPREAEPQELWRRRDAVRRELCVGHPAPKLVHDLLGKPVPAFLIGARLRERGPNKPSERLEILEQRLQVRTRVVHRSEMSQKQRLRRPRLDARGARRPEIEIDVRRRRGRQHVSTIDTHAGNVAHERHTAGVIKVADVVRGVARRVRHVEESAARLDALATPEHHQVLLRHGRKLSPEAIHVVAVQPRGALNQLLGMRHVPRAALVHQHFDPRMTPDDGAGRAGVVEMDVREQQVGDVAES